MAVDVGERNKSYEAGNGVVYKGRETDGWPPGLTNQKQAKSVYKPAPSICLECDSARRIRVAFKVLKGPSRFVMLALLCLNCGKS